MVLNDLHKLLDQKLCTPFSLALKMQKNVNLTTPDVTFLDLGNFPHNCQKLSTELFCSQLKTITTAEKAHEMHVAIADFRTERALSLVKMNTRYRTAEPKSFAQSSNQSRRSSIHNISQQSDCVFETKLINKFLAALSKTTFIRHLSNKRHIVLHTSLTSEAAKQMHQHCRTKEAQKAKFLYPTTDGRSGPTLFDVGNSKKKVWPL